MPKILVVAEFVGGSLDETAQELAGAARMLAATASQDYSVSAVVLGEGLSEASAGLALWFDEVFVFDDASYAVPDAEVYGAAVAPLVEREQPRLVLIPHTNNGMDLAPWLAIRGERTMVTDCLSLEWSGESIEAVRMMYSSKVQARVTVDPSAKGFLITVRPGAYSVPDGAPGPSGSVIAESSAAGAAPRRRFVRTVTPGVEDVDITQADLLVSIGRGIEEEENLEIVEKLAVALGAEVSCSRPVADKKWLPKTRQVGTSGATVKPKMYLAIGISGSFQHLGGLKGSPFIAAINSDARAPIFEVAQVGIVGDLFDVVPVLTEKLEALNS